MTPVTDHSEENRVDLNRVFQALSRTERRRILVALMKDNPCRPDEFETVEFRSDDTERETISIEFHHTHLPHLDEASFIDWDRETGQITRGENFEDIRPLLELLDDHQDELSEDWP